MALMPARSPEVRPGRESGVTLVELVMALAMSALVVGMGLALFKDIGAAARFVSVGRDDAFETRTAFNSLCDNVLAGQGILFVSSNRIQVLNRAGKRVDYAWEDSTLTVNGRPLRFRVGALEVAPFGPALPPGEEWSRERLEYSAVDSLDDDRDGSIDFRELDRDRNGELDPYESRFIARLVLTLTTVRSGIATTRLGSVHPRNHAREWSGDAMDALPGVGDFGR